jgi:colanic acid/amylovoran biosynthesis glycosyltransferase
MKKNIAIIASYIHPIRQKHLLDWYADLFKESVNTKLFLGSKSPEIPYADNYKINSKSEKIIYAISNLLTLKKTPSQLKKKLQPLIRFKPEIIHLLTSNAFGHIEPILESGSIKLIVSFRGYDINVFPYESRENKMLTQRIFQKADVLHFISEDLRRTAIKLKADPKKCIVINRSIKIDKNENLNKTAMRNKKLIILSVGRLVWEKGYLYALETISILKNKGYDFEYHIAGSGNDYGMLNYHVNRLNIADIVIFKGELSRKEIKKALLNSDVYFQPSLSEALSLALIEASYYKLPIISSDTGGIPEVVKHGVTGLLSNVCRSENYAENIIKLFESEDLRIQMGNNAHDRIMKNFSRVKEIEKWRELYYKFD